MEAISIPGIVVAVYAIIEIFKQILDNNPKFLKFVPLIAGVLGIAIGLLMFFAVPGFMPTDNVVIAIAIGASSGLTATGANQLIKQLKAKEDSDDGGE